MLTDEEINAIRERAEKATPGPWVRGKWPGDLEIVRQADWQPCGNPDHDDCSVAQIVHRDVALVNQCHEQRRVIADAEFIAAANPETVTQLCDALAAARSEAGAAKDALAKLVGTLEPAVDYRGVTVTLGQTDLEAMREAVAEARALLPEGKGDAQ